MKIFLIVVIAFAAIIRAEGRDMITVDPNDLSGGREGVDLSGTDLTSSFCEAKGKECRGADLETAKFSATARQCSINCNLNLQCLSAFLDSNKACHLRSNRCTAGQLTAASGGLDIYRLKKGESCPAGRQALGAGQVAYSNRYCALWGKRCTGRNIYRNGPLKLSPVMECVKKCQKIATCAGVDYVAGKCEPKDNACRDAELEDAPGVQNIIRLPESVADCPSNRGPPSVKPPPATQPPPTEPVVKPHTILGTLTDTCDRKENVHYCERQYACVAAEANIRIIVLSSVDACKAECNRECACQGFVFDTIARTCWLKSTPCTVMDLRIAHFKFYMKAHKGETCQEAQQWCLKKYDYCPRTGDCWLHNLRAIALTPHAECKKRCDEECACKAFFNDGITCWLKHLACTELSQKVVATYYVKKSADVTCDFAIRGRCANTKFKYCYRRGDCVLHNIRTVPLVTIDACKKVCDKECACKSFWHDGALTCVMKSIACTTMTHHLWPSRYYVKIGANEQCGLYGEEK